MQQQRAKLEIWQTNSKVSRTTNDSRTKQKIGGVFIGQLFLYPIDNKKTGLEDEEHERISYSKRLYGIC